MRWHIVAGIICAVFGVVGVIGGLFLFGVFAYYNLTMGPIAHSGGQYESLDQIALTWRNVSRFGLAFLSGVLACVSSRYWFKQDNRRGAILFLLAFIALGVSTALVSRR